MGAAAHAIIFVFTAIIITILPLRTGPISRWSELGLNNLIFLQSIIGWDLMNINKFHNCFQNILNFLYNVMMSMMKTRNLISDLGLFFTNHPGVWYPNSFSSTQPVLSQSKKTLPVRPCSALV